MQIILRLLSFPFLLVVVLISILYKTVKWSYLFLRYGGELLTYKKGDRKMIYDIYEQLKKKEK